MVDELEDQTEGLALIDPEDLPPPQLLVRLTKTRQAPDRACLPSAHRCCPRTHQAQEGHTRWQHGLLS